MKRSKFLIVVVVVLAISAAIAATAIAGSAAGPYRSGQIARWGQLAPVRVPPPLYAEGAMATELDPLKVGTQVYVVDFQYDRVKVYSPVDGRAGWIFTSSLALSEQYINLGVVISANTSLREEPNTRAKLLASPKNGEVVNIVFEANGWYHLQYKDPRTNLMYEGYVRTDFIMAQPRFIVMKVLTDIYAMPQSNSKKVGQVPKGTTLAIIGEMNNYYAVNLRSASGFVRTRDVTLD